MISWLLSVTACCFGFKLNGVEGVKRCPPKLPTALRQENTGVDEGGWLDGWF